LTARKFPALPSGETITVTRMTLEYGGLFDTGNPSEYEPPFELKP
jgi:hypothetical protein